MADNVPPRKRRGLLFSMLLLSGLLFGGNEAVAVNSFPSSHNFGEVGVGVSSVEQEFIIRNLSFTNSVSQVNVTLTGEFHILSNACIDAELNAMGTCVVKVSFTPLTVGAKTADIIVDFLDAGGNPQSFSIPLQGTGIGGHLVFTPESYGFGNVNMGEISTAQTFTIANTGNNDVELLEFEFSGADGFSILNDSCADTTLSVGASCTADVQFQPQFQGLAISTFSPVSSNAPSIVADLSGKGTAVPNISVTPLSINFGAVDIGSAATPQMLFIGNTGNGILQLGQNQLSDNSAFQTKDTCPQVLAGNVSCGLTVSFQPEAEGPVTGTLSIPSNDPDEPEVKVTLSGTGRCPVDVQINTSISPDSVDFGSELINTSHSVQQSVSIETKGCRGVYVDKNNIKLEGSNVDEFTISDFNCYSGSWRSGYAVSTHSSCKFLTVFTPESAGTKTAELKVFFDDPMALPVMATLTGTAVETGEPAITVNPVSHTYNTVNTGFGSESKAFDIENTGNVNLHFDDLSIAGTDSDDFKVNKRGCFYQHLKPGQSCFVDVGFQPREEGDKQANLHVAYYNTAMDVPLNGTAIIPPCDDSNITVQSAQIGNWVTKGTWDTGSVPVKTDVVRINLGHIITGPAFINVKTLCVGEQSVLRSRDLKGTMLEIQATDYIENKGTIRGRPGKDEIVGKNCDRSETGMGYCAYPGASVLLKVGNNIKSSSKSGDWWWYSYSSGGPILNEGKIKAGDGGIGTHYGAPGGDAIVLGRNTANKGKIQAGNGGWIRGNNGQAGKGGATQIWGKLGGSGYLYNQHGAKALAGTGGGCFDTMPDITDTRSGSGGNLWLVSLPNVHLSGGKMKAGKSGTGCADEGRDGSVTIEPGLIDLSGQDTSIEGGDVLIYGGTDWTLDLSNTSEALIAATGDVTLSVGEGSVVDLQGSADKVINAAGSVRIASDSIVLDKYASLEDAVKGDGANIVVAPAKILRNVILGGPTKLLGDPGEILSIRLTLTNSAPEADIYTITAANSAGWTLSNVPDILEVPALSAGDLALDISLPATAGAVSTVTLTAVSQADPEALAAASVQVAVATAEDIPDNEVNICPATGIIDSHCFNYGRVLSNANITINGSVTGGDVSGTVTSEGAIGEAKFPAGTVLTGGVFTGSITNEGALGGFEFRGDSLSGGTLTGTVNNTRNGDISDVTLGKDVIIDGGVVEGDISGDANTPAVLKNLRVAPRTVLANVILGENVDLGAGIRFGDGVRFELPAYIPTGMDLSEMLPTVPESGDCELLLDQPVSLDLSADVVKDAQGILTAINNMPGLQGGVITLLQDAAHGYVYMDMAGMRFALQPWTVKHSEEDATIEADSAQSVRFRTARRDVFTQPALQDPCGLHAILAGFGIDKWQIQGDGNVRIPVSDNSWASFRPDWMSTPSNAPPGLGVVGDSLLSLVFTDGNGATREQVLYPAAANLAALTAFVRELGLEPVFDPQGGMSVDIGGQVLRVVFDYMVAQDKHNSIGSMQVLPLLDENGENTSDFVLVYPNGDSQSIFLDVPEEVSEEETP
ncbi:MAG: choice-of-anchor D domain-containing protein [Gammaproteobacteria bacterium]|nr:choice-of-anchor D domain-containing protein [Gammaproteobacteria bacterium]